MKKLSFLFLAIFFAVLSSCSENKSNANADDSATKTNTEATQDGASEPTTGVATFTINGKSYTCNEVGAISLKNDNVLEIIVTKGGEETTSFSFQLKNIGKGQQKFSTAGTLVSFTTPGETFSNRYKPDCTDEETYTEGTINITSLVDYTNEQEGRIEANFEGKLGINRPVASYICGNGKSSTSKAEVVNIKGALVGSYINR